MSGSSRSWSPEKRARQAEIIRQRKPWLHSTGPQTDAGKQAIRDNALKEGRYDAQMRRLRALLNRQSALLKLLEKPENRRNH